MRWPNWQPQSRTAFRQCASHGSPRILAVVEPVEELGIVVRTDRPGPRPTRGRRAHESPAPVGQSRQDDDEEHELQHENLLAVNIRAVGRLEVVAVSEGRSEATGEGVSEGRSEATGEGVSEGRSEATGEGIPEGRSEATADPTTRPGSRMVVAVLIYLV